jgi:uncharacterized protein YchJ
LEGRAGPTGIIELRSTYLVLSGEVGVQQERSLFVREDERWFYLDAIG